MNRLPTIASLKQLIFMHKISILYTGSSMLKVLATMLSGIVIATYIYPDDLGLWGIISLASTYSLFLQAGLINGLNLELPLAYGRSENDSAKKMAGVTQTFSLAISMLVLLVGVLCFFCLHNHEYKVRYGVLAISTIIALTFYQNYLLSTFRSIHSFQKLSTIQIVDACTNILFIVFVAYYAYYGLIIRAALILFISVLLLHVFRPVKVSLLWDKKLFYRLLKVGVPIFVLYYIEAIAITSDKMWLTMFSTATNVGLYVFGLYAFNLFVTFSSSIASYIYPRMSYDYGKTGDKILLWRKVKKVTSVLASLQLPLVVAGFFIIPVAVRYFFPNYTLSIAAMQLLLIAGYFKGCVVGVNAVWSIKSWRHMIFYQTSYAIMLILLSFIGVYFFENKIVGAASGILLANFLSLFLGIYVTYLATHPK